ncbi:cyclase [Acrocarpospora pleiomorpha]|uniref:Cyclase n=1 Tax=Acrocarpospora pleiomorpha TaxID=90975 RepID=A0A5M3XCF9_9ACTN|nr:cyclase family protein [Acrocarpospora pleiomorpha]GES19355.1 cyclase [Acrocarpospora pleiomorpha]
MGAELMTEVSGRGALANIDGTVIKRAMAAVSTMEVRSLGLQVRNGKGPVGPRRQPPQHFMVRDGGDAALAPEASARHGFSFSDDILLIPTHGTTHMDALCHVWQDGRMYGDLPADLVTSRGAKRLGIEEAGPVVTRVLIVDAVPEGRPWLDAAEPVSLDLVRHRLDAAGLVPERGDALFLRTGWVEAWAAGVQDQLGWGGLDVDAIDWVLESGFPIIGADNIGVEMSPASDPACAVPLHVRLMRDHGVYFVELLDLAGFAGAAVAGMLTLAPLNIVGATASPLAPVVVF